MPQAELGDEVANAILTPNGGRAGVGVGALLETFDRQSSGEYGTEPVASTVSARDYKGPSDLVAHSLRAEGFDASEDGTGRGTPLVPVAMLNMMGAKGMCAFEENPQTSYTLTQGCQSGADMHAVCFTAKDYGADASDISPTLRSGGHDGSHANGGVMPAVAFSENQQGQIWEHDSVQALNKGGGKPGQGYAAIRTASAVRRLTPMECERLQGFPDDYTLIPYRGKPAADGPRYKALGNSMAVPVMAYIGQRIAMVEALCEQREAA